VSKEATVETVAQRFREQACALLYDTPFVSETRWVETGRYPDDGDHVGIRRMERVARALANAEATGLANRDERCLQSDMQRIRERLAAEKAWDEGYYIGVRARESADTLGPDINPYRLAAKGDGNGE
jgi:hypothetical protein